MAIQFAVVTGGAGFFGSILKRRLLADGVRCVSIDLQPDLETHPLLTCVQGDIRDSASMAKVFAGDQKPDVIFHCAALLAHDVTDQDELWDSNVEGTRLVAKAATAHGVPLVVYISTNCLWGRPFGRPITEIDEPRPLETYGKSKWEAEKVLFASENSFRTISLRVPTIVDAGRLGLLAILFEFIVEGRTVWMVGDGENRYQFIYSEDLADACVRAATASGGPVGVFNVGSNDVKPMREVFQFVINAAGTGSKIRHLPSSLTVNVLRFLHAIRLSPLGPYHYRMIAESFIFDTEKTRVQLGWTSTLNNEQMLLRAFKYYSENETEIKARTDVSAHRKPARLGAIRILKWLS